MRKYKGYWDDIDNCKKAVNECKTLKMLKKKYSGCYYSLLRNGWKNVFFNIKDTNLWNDKEKCISKAKEYDCLSDFERKCYQCYLVMKKKGWLTEVFPLYVPKCKDEICNKNNKANVKTISKPFGYWNNIENCINECKRYRNITEVKNKSNGCYASILRHEWENTCFPSFKKRKPNGFWDIKENCITEAVKYRNLREFQLNSYGAYYSCKINGWIDEINNMYDKTILYHSYDEMIHSVYAYEFPLFNSCYIGRTNCLKRRHQQHLKDKNDTVYKFCKEKNTKFPNYKVLKENLNAQDSQYYEDYYVRKFKDDGWIILNKAVTGVNKGSLGAICKWNYNECKKEASKYASIAEFKKHNQSAYNACNKNGWTYDFFSQKKLSNHYWDSYDNCKKAFLKCKNTKELIKRFGGCYNAIKKNSFTDLKYPK